MKKLILLSGLIICLLSVFNNSYGQSAIIKGKIIDVDTKEPLLSVNMVEVDKNGRFIAGTVSDYNGNYVFKVSNINNPIQVSFIGYKKQTFMVEGRSQIDFELESESIQMEEVVFVGAKMGNDGVTSVRDRATAVARIELEDLKSVMSTTVEDMLQGRIGNVDISSVSGDPGSGLNIRIRGTASLNARNQPLIVINGIPYDANIDDNFDFASADIEKFGNLIDVSPEDIESIEVLKDAASTAAWGSRASNGVLMIKTKRGAKSKPIFEYTFKATSSHEPPPIPMLDGAGYARLITEEHYNYDYNTFYSQEIAYDPEWEEYHNYSQNTNWVKEITQTALTQQHDFSVRGGGEKSRYNMSMGLADEGGTTIGNGLRKLNLRSSLDYDLSSKLQFKSDIMYTHYDQDNTYDVEDSEFGGWKSLRSNAYRRMPNLSIYDRDTSNSISDNEHDYFTPSYTLQGSAKDYYNPVAFANLGTQKRYRDNARALFSTKYYITPRLILNTTVTLDIFDNKISKFLPYKALGFDYGNDITNRAVNEFSKKSSIYTINQLIYRPETGENHDLVFMGQFDTEETLSRWYKTESNRSASPFLTEPVNDKTLNYFGANSSKYRSLGLFLTGSYKYLDKYSVMLGAKYEGNSKFSQESRWGLFPTVSGFWRISEESFLKDLSFINDLKIRYSWGQSGNSPAQNYLYFNTYEAGASVSYMDMQGVQPTGIELTSLQWETIEQSNPGISFIGFNGRMNVEMDYYVKTTLNLYLENSGIPDHSGFGTVNRNDGEMENRGMEFYIDYTVIKKKDLQLSFNVNVSRNQNKVLRLPENYSLEYGDMLTNGEYKISVTPGEALGGFFGYDFIGVYKSDDDAIVRDVNDEPVYGLNIDTPLTMIMGGASGYVFAGGDARYADRNYDGQIDELDLVYLGDLNPKFMGGAGSRLQYKNIIFNTFLYFKVGQKIINQTRMDTEKMYNYDNQSTATNYRWRREGDITDMPRALYNDGFNWLGSDRFVEDGTYLRLKTVSISYLFKPEMAKKLRVKDLKVFATGYNLYTWTKYSGQDPDVAPPSNPDTLPKDISRTPPSKKFMFGVNLTF
ncbi:MAG: SusC/RagA family TonB-linked outer membrane protein [Bacteroidales bacterium]|nr:SusC/RagA family TonB-linked outer membrane protein [Bacteroidales bacterium]MCF8391206.1 SusC/RagA family TonB-linked outer membrane protein [Bacteroidales bacterium]